MPDPDLFGHATVTVGTAACRWNAVRCRPAIRRNDGYAELLRVRAGGRAVLHLTLTSVPPIAEGATHKASMIVTTHSLHPTSGSR